MRYERPVLQGENCVSREESREKNNSETSSLSEKKEILALLRFTLYRNRNLREQSKEGYIGKQKRFGDLKGNSNGKTNRFLQGAILRYYWGDR